MELIHKYPCELHFLNSSSSSSRNKDEEEEEMIRNWLELPVDVMSMIFLKLGTNNILVTAQWVCTSWWKLSKQPHLFRSIHVEEVDSIFGRSTILMNCDLKFSTGMAREAINRSCGQLVEFSVQAIATDELLHYMSEKSPSLKCIRLVSCYEKHSCSNDVSCYEQYACTNDGLIKLAKKLPQLEELEIIHCSYFSEDVFETFGRFCPCLKSCRLNNYAPCLQSCRLNNYAIYKSTNSLARVVLAISKNMPELRFLNLFGNMLKDNDLRAVLDGCPHLESLDLRQCFDLKFAGDLEKRCGNIKLLRLPNDPTDDFDYGLLRSNPAYEDFSKYEPNDDYFSYFDLFSDDDNDEVYETNYDTDYVQFLNWVEGMSLIMRD